MFGEGEGDGGAKRADFSVTPSSSKMVSNPSRAQIELNMKSASFGAIMSSFLGPLRKSVGHSLTFR
jgi:hypothetical protein